MTKLPTIAIALAAGTSFALAGDATPNGTQNGGINSMPASANTSIITHLALDGRIHQGLGGEFRLAVPDPGLDAAAGYTGQTRLEKNNFAAQTAGADFHSFCLEIDERTRPNTDYYAQVNTDALSGGAANNGPSLNGGDTLSNATKWLFFNFSNGGLNGTAAGDLYNYDLTGSETLANGQSYSRSDAAQAMQVAIWLLEDEAIESNGDVLRGDNGESLNASAGVLDLAFLLRDSANNLGGNGFDGMERVVALNMRRGGPNGADSQDMLGIVMIPLPHASGLAMAGIGLIAVRRRR
jgi:hypothetical protein